MKEIKTINEIKRPDKHERKLARNSYSSRFRLSTVKNRPAEIEIEETGEKRYSR